MDKVNEPMNAQIFLKVAALGAVAGLRALLAPALFSYKASQPEKNAFSDNFLGSRKISVVLGLLAVGELVGDKLPSTPNRTDLPGLSARIVSGAVVGGSICAAYRKSVITGAILGAAASVGAAYAGQEIRRQIAYQTDIPSELLGAAEDVIAIGIGISTLEAGE